MAYKQFTANTLSSTDVNDYLMNQSVIVFANSTARLTAIPSPTEGMVTYLQDTNELHVYDGSTWLTVAVTADDQSITTSGSITADTGIISNGTTRTTGLSVGNSSALARIYSSAGDNFNLRTHTNTPNPNFSLGVQNGSGSDSHIPVQWENGVLRLKGSGTSTSSGIYIDSNNIARQGTAQTSLGNSGQTHGTMTMVPGGAYNPSLGGISSLNSWVTVLSGQIDCSSAGVNATYVNAIFNMSLYVHGATQWLMRVLVQPATGGSYVTSQQVCFRNTAFDHFAGVHHASVYTANAYCNWFAQFYGAGTTIQTDSNDYATCFFYTR